MFQVTTDALDDDGWIDSRYTCDMDNSSPELRWNHPPSGTVGFAVIAEDPDAPSGLFSHWVIYNIPATIDHLPAGIPAQDTLPNRIRQGTNDFGKLGYAGPCPPAGGPPHRYFFKVYALSALPDLPPRSNRAALLSAIAPFILSQAEVIGRYQRSFERAGQRAG